MAAFRADPGATPRAPRLAELPNDHRLVTGVQAPSAIPVGRLVRVVRRRAPAPQAGAPRRGRPAVPPRDARRGRPLIYWPPVVVAAVLSLLLIGGLLALARLRPAAAGGPAALAAPPAPAAGKSGEAPAMPPESNPPAAAPDPSPPPAPGAGDRPTRRPPPVADTVLPVDEPFTLPPHPGGPAPCPTAAAPKCAAPHNYGTSVNFVDGPAEAAAQALRDNKLLFVLHVAGNFEDDKFT